jgi:hypothetical protein
MDYLNSTIPFFQEIVEKKSSRRFAFAFGVLTFRATRGRSDVDVDTVGRHVSVKAFVAERTFALIWKMFNKISFIWQFNWF